MPDDVTQKAEAIAQAAGLDKAWAEHRTEVLEAIANARRLHTAFRRPTDPAAEPLPAYAVPGAQGERGR